MTTRNIYKRMAQHIDNYKVYLTDSKSYITSYKILKDGIEKTKTKIGLIETIFKNCKKDNFIEFKLMQINNFLSNSIGYYVNDE
jgi:hypothetical protein